MFILSVELKFYYSSNLNVVYEPTSHVDLRVFQCVCVQKIFKYQLVLNRGRTHIQTAHKTKTDKFRRCSIILGEFRTNTLCLISLGTILLFF